MAFASKNIFIYHEQKYTETHLLATRASRLWTLYVRLCCECDFISLLKYLHQALGTIMGNEIIHPPCVATHLCRLRVTVLKLSGLKFITQTQRVWPLNVFEYM